MDIFKKHHPHLLAFLLIVGISLGIGTSFLNPGLVHVKENVNPSAPWPNAPTNLQATPSSYNQIDLSWTPPTYDEFTHLPAESYVIYRSLTGSDFATVPAYANTNGTTYSDTGASPQTTYYYKVAAINKDGEGPNSNVVSVTTPTQPQPQTPPPQPANFSGGAYSPREIRLVWDQTPNIDYYEVYKSTDGSNFNLFASPTANQLNDGSVLPSQTYWYYLKSRKGGLSSAPTQVVQIITPQEVIAPPLDTTPPQFTLIQTTPDTTSVEIHWTTDEVTIGEVRYGESSAYGAVLASSNSSMDHWLIISNLLPNTTYHFQLRAEDTSKNSSLTSDATFTTLVVSTPPPSPTQLFVAPQNKTLVISWKNPTVPDVNYSVLIRTLKAPVQTPQEGQVLYKGLGEQFVDQNVVSGTNYFYTLFAINNKGQWSSPVSAEGQLPSVIVPVPDTCNPDQVDCRKEACKNFAQCKKTTTPLPAVPLATTALNFFAGDHNIPLTPEKNKVSGLSGASLRISFPGKKLINRPDNITFQIAGNSEQAFTHDIAEDTYFTDLTFPETGNHEAKIIFTTKGKTTSLPLLVRSIPLGSIVDARSQKISDVHVSLLNDNGTIFPGDRYAQQNPLESKDGSFGWMVPNGSYFVQFHKDGYENITTPLVVVNDNMVRNAPVVAFIPLPEPINTNVPVAEKPNYRNYISSIMSGSATPFSVGLALLTTVLQLSILDILALLRLLFLQPLLLIGSRKRYAWGIVYNSLNKLPVDLAIVRLVDTTTNRVVQTRVTSRNGKYFFKTPPGTYRLEVLKDGMTTPSKLLANYKEDGRKTDLYHGEELHITDAYPIVALVVPADPKESEKTPARLRLEKIGRVIQLLVSGSGIIITLISLYLNPMVWSTWLFLALHILLFVMFWRLAIPPRPRGWGVVYGVESSKPVNRVVARLFNTQFNKLVSTQITDHQGRYYFLAGDSTYFIRFEHPEFEIKTTPTIDLNGKEEENIALNVGLKEK